MNEVYKNSQRPDNDEESRPAANLGNLPREVKNLIMNELVADSFRDTAKNIGPLKQAFRAGKDMVENSPFGEYVYRTNRLGAANKKVFDHEIPAGSFSENPNYPIPDTSGNYSSPEKRISAAKNALEFASDTKKTALVDKVLNLDPTGERASSLAAAMDSKSKFNEKDQERLYDETMEHFLEPGEVDIDTRHDAIHGLINARKQLSSEQKLHFSKKTEEHPVLELAYAETLVHRLRSDAVVEAPDEEQVRFRRFGFKEKIDMIDAEIDTIISSNSMNTRNKTRHIDLLGQEVSPLIEETRGLLPRARELSRGR